MNLIDFFSNLLFSYKIVGIPVNLANYKCGFIGVENLMICKIWNKIIV